jgi:hypothetical protein
MWLAFSVRRRIQLRQRLATDSAVHDTPVSDEDHNPAVIQRAVARKIRNFFNTGSAEWAGSAPDLVESVYTAKEPARADADTVSPFANGSVYAR